MQVMSELKDTLIKDFYVGVVMMTKLMIQSINMEVMELFQLLQMLFQPS